MEIPAEEHTEENEMKKSLIVSGGALIIAVASGVVQAQKDSTSNNMKNVIYVAADNATFKQSPMGRVSMAVLWGDPDKGVHGTYTKFEPGFDAGMHTHTNDVWIVGIKGAYLYKDEAGEKQVPAESLGWQEPFCGKEIQTLKVNPFRVFCCP